MQFQNVCADRLCADNLHAFIVFDDCPLDPRQEWGADDDDPDTQAWKDGDVFGILIAPADTENFYKDQLDSCWGFYGWDWAHESAKEMLSEAEQHYRESAGWVAI